MKWFVAAMLVVLSAELMALLLLLNVLIRHVVIPLLDEDEEEK
ncbi:MAG: hypothetical protein OXN19_16130 [Caldilineaceae bacterium]|nr:hypothetical protein [Caldilineaceae bacterium]